MFEFHEHGEVCEIRLAHPPVNAMASEFCDGFIEALNSKAASHPAIVISGQPGMFSAGLDVVRLLQLDRPGIESFWGSFFGMLGAVAASPVPVAFAITGHSPAGGAVLAIHGDYRVMSSGDYRIGLNEVQVGLIVPPRVQKVLARLVGTYPAERLLVAGAMLTPEEAREKGMVDEVVDGYEETIARAVAWCTQHIRLPRQAMLTTREIMRADLRDIHSDMGEEELKAFGDLWFSDETQQTIGQLVASLKNKSA